MSGSQVAKSSFKYSPARLGMFDTPASTFQMLGLQGQDTWDTWLRFPIDAVFISCSCDQNICLKQCKEGKVQAGSQFESTAHHGRESMAIGTQGGWLDCVHSQGAEADRNQCWFSVHFLLFKLVWDLRLWNGGIHSCGQPSHPS